MFKSAFPDMSATVEDVVAEGDKVVTRVTIRGTHQGEVEEFGPPTVGVKLLSTGVPGVHPRVMEDSARIHPGFIVACSNRR
jgi:hypothetical protein